jgi:glucose/arabinose dehydrogenase
MRPMAFIPVVLLSLVVPVVAISLPVGDPFTDKIKKGDARVELKEVAKDLVTPVWGTHAGDGSGRLFIVDQAGVARIVKEGKPLAEPFIDVKKHMVQLMPGFDERGFLGLAFHPGYADKSSPGYRKLYTFTSEPAGPCDYPMPQGAPTDCISVVAEWQVSADNPDAVDPASRRVVLSWGKPQFNHNGGSIVFGPDKLLYIAVGDGGAGNDLGEGHAPQGNGQLLTTPLGKILRIDPLGKTGAKSKNGRYSIPDSNPFVGKDGLDEIYSFGMRNPYRISFDRQTGELVAADVGQGKIEEIDLIKLGGNYGWPVKEGSFYFIRQIDLLGNVTFEPPTGDLPPNLIDPVAQYDHDEGLSITGGFVYRGKAIPALAGKYIFGDWVKAHPKAETGRLFYADLKTGDIRELVIGKDDRELGGFVSGFGEDQDGEIYVLINESKGPNTSTGATLKIVPAE